MDNIKIYVLIDPNSKEVRYVGKTKSNLNKRLSSHCRNKNDKSHKKNWINILLSNNQKPEIQLIEICKEDAWVEREVYWISYYKMHGNLTNMTEGGDGLPKGYKHSIETIEKIRLAAKKPNKGQFKKGSKRINSLQAIAKIKKKVIQYDLDGYFIKIYNGIIDAANESGINKNSIRFCMTGKIYRAGQFQWRYYTDNYDIKIEKYINTKRKNEKT